MINKKLQKNNFSDPNSAVFSECANAMRDITLFSGQAGRSRYEDGSFLQSDASRDEISHKETHSDKRLHALQQAWVAKI